jgi:PUA domain protein
MGESENRVRKRRALRRKDAGALLEEASGLVGEVEASKVEEAEAEDGRTVYLLDDEILFFRDGDSLVPTLRGPYVDRLPAAVVDMGAVPFVCKGADVMAPGITEVRGEFEEGRLVVVRDIRHGKALAVGRALRPSKEIIASRKGRAVQNLHYVGDKLWNAKA